MAWDEEEMDSTIREYAEENGEITKEALNDPETDLPSYSTVRRHYGGLPDCIEELGLDIEASLEAGTPEYSRSDIIDWIREDSENGIAPKQEDFTDSRLSRGPIWRLFGSYTNAVFMAGKEPAQGWHKQPKDKSEEILAEYLQTTRENYWHGDPDDRWNTEPSGDAKYLNPTQNEFPFSAAFLQYIDDGLRQPDMRLNGGRRGYIDVQIQDEIMDIVEKSEKYYPDIVDEIEDTDITEAQVKMVLDPESDNSFGRWMAAGEERPPVSVEKKGQEVERRAENEFPENILPMLTPRF